MLSTVVSSFFTKNTKDELSLETFFIIVFCIVDELYRLLVGPQSNLRTSNNNNPVFTDVEVITIALVGELKGENSERAWWRFVSKNYGHLFPHLCSRTRYGRRLKRLSKEMEMIRQNLLYRVDANFTPPDPRIFLPQFQVYTCHGVIRSLPYIDLNVNTN